MNFKELNDLLRTKGLTEPRLIDKSQNPQKMRLELFKKLQDSVGTFPEFCEQFFDIVNRMKPCFIQQDIAVQLQENSDIFFSAQRSTGKTQLIVAWIVWIFIKYPRLFLMFMSSTGKVSKNVFNAVDGVFMKTPALMCMYPTGAGGTAGFESGFTIHSDVRQSGDKDPSLRCTTTDSKNTGSRAHVIIFDDFEVPENSSTQGKIENLLERHDTILPYLVSLEDENGKVLFKKQRIYIGTPQHNQSMYFTKLKNIRKFIYPGRLPTQDQLDRDAYCGSLAPIILDMCKKYPDKMTGYGIHGDLGINIYQSESHRLGELFQLEMEDQSNRYKLDYLLDPSQTENSIKPLKLEYIHFAPFTTDRFPNTLTSGYNERIPLPLNFPLKGKQLFYANADNYVNPTHKNIHMSIDPAGMSGKGDETSYAVGFASGPYIYILECGGLRMTEDTAESNFEKLANIAKKYGVNKIWIEENFAGGFVTHNMRPIINGIHPCAIEGYKVSNKSSKEQRILYTLEPLFHSRRIVFHPEMIEKDDNSIQHYATNERKNFSLFFQLANMTNEKNTLKHDDRIDALANLCSVLTPQTHGLASSAFKELPNLRNGNIEQGMTWVFN